MARRARHVGTSIGSSPKPTSTPPTTLARSPDPTPWLKVVRRRPCHHTASTASPARLPRMSPIIPPEPPPHPRDTERSEHSVTRQWVVRTPACRPYAPLLTARAH